MRSNAASWVADHCGPRIVYERSPLALVVVQLRYFSGPLSEEAVTTFQKKVQDEYPIPIRQNTQTTQVVAGPGQVGLQSGAASVQWSFASEDDNWIVTLAEQVLSLEVRRYLDFPDFSARFEGLVGALVETLVVTRGQRLGLRYINEIRSDKPPLEHVLRDELRGLTGLTAFQRDIEHSLNSTVVNMGRGMKAHIQSGILPGGTTVAPKDESTPDPSRFLLLDVDAFQEFKAPHYLTVAPKIVSERLAEYHHFVSSFFRWSTTDDYRATLGGDSDHD